MFIMLNLWMQNHFRNMLERERSMSDEVFVLWNIWRLNLPCSSLTSLEIAVGESVSGNALIRVWVLLPLMDISDYHHLQHIEPLSSRFQILTSLLSL